ncbi:MAG: forkhead-associated protein, partial [Bacteroidota bacterium]
HNVVRGLIRKLRETPRERNFWKFLTAYREKIPKETYDYVFYIIAATVIGENPGLFGFEMENPLAVVKSPASL